MNLSSIWSKRLLASLALLLSLVTAQALPVAFNFDGSGGLAPSYTFNSGGISVTVTAAAWDGSAWRTASVGQYSGGLGATNSSGGDAGSPQHAVDNNGWKDYLIMQFSLPVDVASVRLGWVSGDSDFRYWIGDSLAAVRTTAGGTGVSGGSSSATYAINGANLLGGYFSIAASPSNSSSNDYFKVKTLTVDYTTVPDHGGTLALLGLALAGMMVYRRRALG